MELIYKYYLINIFYMLKKKFNPDQNYKDKINNFILDHEINKKNINILEFGVREGRSTKMFLDLCASNGGKLISVDIDDYSNLFNDNKLDISDNQEMMIMIRYQVTLLKNLILF